MSTITGLLVGTDGMLRTVEVANVGGTHLASMYAHIGCRAVDVVAMRTEVGGVDAWVDDEGAYTAAPNIVMSAIAEAFTGSPSRIFGKALLLTSNHEGETLGLGTEQRRYLEELRNIIVTLPGIQDDILTANLEAILNGRT